MQTSAPTELVSAVHTAPVDVDAIHVPASDVALVSRGSLSWFDPFDRDLSCGDRGFRVMEKHDYRQEVSDLFGQASCFRARRERGAVERHLEDLGWGCDDE